MVFQEELGLPRVFALESDYGEALLRAERSYVADLAAEIRKGTLEGIGMWRRFYDADGGFTPGEDSYDPEWRLLDDPPTPEPDPDR
ncbi:hypothetical protein [Aquihabitans sp. G128]|uniref:hypothetical protein n=1 Tax=Aquihabitans sp. G128 TaxID=2849779 RepID=UPI0020B1B9C6|nr:hypothetical protein [Aquihabitans sp. G128]